MNRTQLRKIQRFLEAVQLDQPDTTVPRLMTLIEVELRGPVDQGSLVRALNFKGSATSKHINNWTRLTAYKKRGPDYLRSDVDPMRMTTRIITTTPKGKAALTRWLDAGGFNKELTYEAK